MSYTLRQLSGYSAASGRLDVSRQLGHACAVRAAGQETKPWREWVKAMEKAHG